MKKTEAYRYLKKEFEETKSLLNSEFGFRMWNRLYSGEGAETELSEFKTVMMHINALIRAIQWYQSVGGRRDIGPWIERTNRLIERANSLHFAYQKYISERQSKRP